MQTPLKAIRLKCLDCSCGSANEVRECPITACPLYPYRFGKNPNMRREPSPAQLEALENGRVAFSSVGKSPVFSENDPAKSKVTTPDNSGKSPAATK